MDGLLVFYSKSDLLVFLLSFAALSCWLFSFWHVWVTRVGPWFALPLIFIFGASLLGAVFIVRSLKEYSFYKKLTLLVSSFFLFAITTSVSIVLSI